MATWAAARQAARGRSAQDWNVEWKAQRRTPRRQHKHWSVLILVVGLIASVGLAIYGLNVLDEVVHRSQVPVEVRGEPWIPSINWGGHR